MFWILFLVSCATTTLSPNPDSDVDSPIDSDQTWDADEDVPDADPDPDISDTDQSVDSDEQDSDEDADPDHDSDPSLSILSINLHCFFTEGTAYSTNEERFQALAQAVSDHDVDILALQELCENKEQSTFDMIRSAVEAETGEAWGGGWVVSHVAWEGTPDQADEGVGLLGRGGLSELTSMEHARQGLLRRVAYSGVYDSDFGRIRVVNLHLDHGDENVRSAQVRDASVMGLALGDPSLDVVIAGDLNAQEGSEPHTTMLNAGFLDLTDSLPAERVDHIFVHRGSSLRAEESITVFDDDSTRLSDHPGVLTRCTTGSPETVTVTGITAEYDPGYGHFLWVRGDTEPLSWDYGWPMYPVAAGQWRFLSTEISGAFEFKTLIDDSDWQSGDNESSSAGEEITVTPTY